MTKWRIIKDGDSYYPQKRRFGFWFNVVDEGYYEYTVSFSSLDKAVDYVENQKQREKVEIVWED